jgi:hypothetical protein
MEVVKLKKVDVELYMEVSGEIHAPAALTPGKNPGTHCIEGCVGPRASLYCNGKNLLLLPRFEPRNVQPAASRYTNYAIPAPSPSINY